MGGASGVWRVGTKSSSCVRDTMLWLGGDGLQRMKLLSQGCWKIMGNKAAREVDNWQRLYDVFFCVTRTDGNVYSKPMDHECILGIPAQRCIHEAGIAVASYDIQCEDV